MLKIDALRLLVQIALKQHERSEALRWASLLFEDPRSKTEDALVLMEIMERDPQEPMERRQTVRLELEKRIGQDASQIALLGRWVLEHQGAQAVLDWLGRYPEVTRAGKPLPILTADALVRLDRWAELETYLSSQQWGVYEAERNAFLAAACRRRGDDSGALLAWKAAIAAARNRPGALRALARQALAEKRSEEAMNAFWAIPFSDPDYLDAQKQLFAYYRATFDSAGMLRLFRRACEERPSDPAAKLSLATLLLVRDEEPGKSLQLAREVYEADAASMRTAAVYAFSLYRSNPCRETLVQALSVLEPRQSEIQDNQDAILFYGLLLAAAERKTEAITWLQKLNRERLFPEMRQRVQEIEASSPVPSPAS
jgi:hypothetical protein